MKKMDAFREITNEVIKMLKEGEVPWQKPWSYERCKNLITKREYHIINHFILARKGFHSPYWLTENQLMKLGGHLKPGSEPTRIYGWDSFVSYKRIGLVGDFYRGRYSFVFKTIEVYNTEQCVGIERYVPNYKMIRFNPVDKAEQIISNMPQRPKIVEGRRQACYYQIIDIVYMPHRESFIDVESYYSTLFHELIHATGHVSRLNRLSPKSYFGSPEYSREELVAEIGAYALCIESSIKPNLINSASYISSWLEVLKKDVTILPQACCDAEKAVNFILRRKKTSKFKKYSVAKEYLDDIDIDQDTCGNEICRSYKASFAWSRTDDKNSPLVLKVVV